MSRQEPKFSFKNLQPVAYLKNFNKMIEYNTKHPLKVSPRHELKTVSLSKFPLPHYYQDMEGIFQSVGKKKVDSSRLKRDSQELKEEQFIKKHNEFMRNILTRFIEHNESRQGLYEKEKKSVKRNDEAKHHLRSLSQPKLLKKKIQKQLPANPEGSPSLLTVATKGSSIKFEEETGKEDSINVLPQLKPRRKKQRMTFRDENKVQEFIVTRKLSVKAPPSRLKDRKADFEPNKLVDFNDEIVKLEIDQVSKQQTFAEKVEKQIVEFQKKMDIQAHSIKYYNFWRDSGQAETFHNTYKGRESRQIEERVDYHIRFRDYETR